MTFCGNLPFALKEGILVEISSVEKGLKCNCICPHCQSKLIAKKGKIKVHHFAHTKDSDCNFGYETALHLAAKKVFLDNDFFFFPAYNIKFADYEDEYNFIKSDRFNYCSVLAEKKLEGLIPDIILSNGSHEILIEIYVTNKLDDVKINRIKKVRDFMYGGRFVCL